jgi:TRAP-type C4-dicarboxylate transport system substrate-binding protein
LFCHRPTLEGFDDDMRALVIGAAVRAVQVQRQAAARLEETLRARLEAEGAMFVDLSDDERAEFVETSRPAIELAHSRLPDDLLSLATA